MNILNGIKLGDYSTMGLGGLAAHLVEISSRDELVEALAWAGEQQLPTLMIGGGSNIIWRDKGFAGLVLVNKILGYDVQDEDHTEPLSATDGEEIGGTVSLTIGAGESWDSVVERSAAARLTGIEALSLIPGSAGATPVQNVGAYGQEIAQTLTSLEAYDAQAGEFVTLAGSDCGFSYRSSRFKGADRGRFYITALTLRLTKGNPEPPFYGVLQAYLDSHGLTEYTPTVIRHAVSAIRRAKLPDPATVRNTGSFFANPIIPTSQYSALAETFLDLPHWPAGPASTKLSAAWLIDQVGFKDYTDAETGMATWPKQSLVLINQHARSTADLLKFKQKIVDAVQAKFAITLQQEPELL